MFIIKASSNLHSFIKNSESWKTKYESLCSVYMSLYLSMKPYNRSLGTVTKKKVVTVTLLFRIDVKYDLS